MFISFTRGHPDDLLVLTADEVANARFKYRRRHQDIAWCILV